MRTAIIVGLLSVLLAACAHKATFENVQLGMTKEELVQAAGHPNSVVASSKVGPELLEVYEYRQAGFWWGDLDDSYWFFFSNNKLQKWGRPYDHYYLY